MLKDFAQGGVPPPYYDMDSVWLWGRWVDEVDGLGVVYGVNEINELGLGHWCQCSQGINGVNIPSIKSSDQSHDAFCSLSLSLSIYILEPPTTSPRKA